MQALLDAKIKNKKTPRVNADDEDGDRGDNVVDLMSALKQSLKDAGGKKPRKKAPAKKAS